MNLLITALLTLNIYFVNPVEASFFYPWIEKLLPLSEDTDIHSPKDTKPVTKEQTRQKDKEQQEEFSYSDEIYRGENPNTKEEAMHILREQEKEHKEQLSLSQASTRGPSSVTKQEDPEYRTSDFLSICDRTTIIQKRSSHELNDQNNNYSNRENQPIILKYLRKEKKANKWGICSERTDEDLSQYCCWKDNTSIKIR